MAYVTSYMQPADRPQSNKELKRLVRKVMRRYRIRAALKEERRLSKSLTKKAREDISNVLSTVRQEFNFGTTERSQKRREGVRKTFQETLVSPHKHSKLQKLLQKSDQAEYAPFGHVQTRPCTCKCGFKLKRNNEKHQCWYKREKLWCPLRTGQDPNNPPGPLLFRATPVEQDNTFPFTDLVGLVLDDNSCADISQTPKLLANRWWNGFRIQYMQREDYPKLYVQYEEKITHAAQEYQHQTRKTLAAARTELESARKDKLGKATIKSRKNVVKRALLLFNRATHVMNNTELPSRPRKRRRIEVG